MSEEYLKLVKYVNAATDLAESVEADIKRKGAKVSNDTVLRLGKFVAAAHAINNMLEHVKSLNETIN
jgi:hypothetical protein